MSKNDLVHELNEIVILSNDLASKIAAGEVVENPLNVVKELMENSVDSGAKNINIVLDDGGLTNITVSDDGKGILAADLPLTVIKNATSKIKKIEDMSYISSFGFRGEALAAIASVSDFSIESVRQGHSGASLQADSNSNNGGYLTLPSKIQQGTTVTVKNLFDNIPARKKFIKSSRHYKGTIKKFIQTFACINQQVSIKAVFDGKLVLNYTQSDDFEKRASLLFDSEKLLCQDISVGRLMVRIAVDSPQNSSMRRDRIYLGVNGRVIKDNSITYLISQSFNRVIPEGSYPRGVFSLTVPSEDIDVNVHPAKTELRFADSRNITNILKIAIEKLLEQYSPDTAAVRYHIKTRGADSLKFEEEETPESILPDEKSARNYHQETNRSINNQFDNSTYPINNNPVSSFGKESVPSSLSDFLQKDLLSESTDITTSITSKPTTQTQKTYDDVGYFETANANQNSFFEDTKEEDRIEEYKIIGQLYDCFIMLESNDGLLLIDQHVAHERVLFESNDLKYEHSTTIVLHTPLAVELNQDDLEKISDNLELLNQHGYKVEIEQTQILITELPTHEMKKGLKNRVVKIFADLIEKGYSHSQDDSIAMSSCRKAIKANDKLTVHEMSHLVKQLFATKNRLTCPHGRPIMMSIDKRDILKFFDRTL